MTGEFEEQFLRLLEATEQRQIDLEAFWTAAKEGGYLNRMKVGEYQCMRGCGLATVVRINDVVLMKTRDYKMRPHTNERRSVAEARAKNTLDGDHHWPGHVYDLGHLAGQSVREWGTRPWGDVASVDLNCRHRLRSVEVWEVLAQIKDVTPGRPGAPTRLP